MPGKDKIIVELLLLFFVVMSLYIFSPDLSSIFQDLQYEYEPPPIQSLFWFLSMVSKMFGNWIFSVFAYMILAAIIYLNGSRK